MVWGQSLSSYGWATKLRSEISTVQQWIRWRVERVNAPFLNGVFFLFIPDECLDPYQKVTKLTFYSILVPMQRINRVAHEVLVMCEKFVQYR